MIHGMITEERLDVGSFLHSIALSAK